MTFNETYVDISSTNNNYNGIIFNKCLYLNFIVLTMKATTIGQWTEFCYVDIPNLIFRPYVTFWLEVSPGDRRNIFQHIWISAENLNNKPVIKFQEPTTSIANQARWITGTIYAPLI